MYGCCITLKKTCLVGLVAHEEYRRGGRKGERTWNIIYDFANGLSQPAMPLGTQSGLILELQSSRLTAGQRTNCQISLHFQKTAFAAKRQWNLDFPV
jgi:hypothetical protein